MGGSAGSSEVSGNGIAAFFMATTAIVLSLLLAVTAPSKPQSVKDPGAPEAAASSTASSSAAAENPTSNMPKTLTVSDAVTPVRSISELSIAMSSSKSTGEQQASFNRPASSDKTTVASTKPTDSAKPTEYLPAGGGLPTAVAIKNSGGSSAPVQRVEFVISKPFKTPTRENSTAKVEGIPVAFGEGNYDAKSDKFSVSLTAPQVALVPNQPIPLAVAIVWPKFSGWTYRGKLTVYQAGQQPVTIENVELDIAKTAAK